MKLAPITHERPDNPLLRCRALLRGRGLFAARVDIVQRGVEHVRRDVEFVGCVGAEPEDVGGQIGQEPGQILSGRLPPIVKSQLRPSIHVKGLGWNCGMRMSVGWARPAQTRDQSEFSRTRAGWAQNRQ